MKLRMKRKFSPQPTPDTTTATTTQVFMIRNRNRFTIYKIIMMRLSAKKRSLIHFPPSKWVENNCTLNPGRHSLSLYRYTEDIHVGAVHKVRHARLEGSNRCDSL